MSHNQMLCINRVVYGETACRKAGSIWPKSINIKHMTPLIRAKITLNKIMAEINAEFCLIANQKNRLTG
jgi:hypothetical protein